MRNNKKSLELMVPEALFSSRNHPLIIAGPCSAESEEQVLQTAHKIREISEVTVFRAGIWKPRTRPNNFEGVGPEGLKWLKRVKEETGLLIAIEVANAQHAYEALKYGIDILWIGARTTVNPFSVQEIANALQGADVPVWVKNPVNPELSLWMGALERLNQAGIKNLAAIHRGFSSHTNTLYRNTPEWGMVIELKRLIPDLPVICDPSHISGKREYLHNISQKALDLAMDGLMIETHIHPDQALSDAAQQLCPTDLKTLIDKLQFRKTGQEGVDHESYLELLRDNIDSLDYKLLEIIKERMEVVEQIGEYKKTHNLTIFQLKRWDHLLANRLEQARQMGLEDAFIKKIYQALHRLSIQVQEAVMNEVEIKVK